MSGCVGYQASAQIQDVGRVLLHMKIKGYTQNNGGTAFILNWDQTLALGIIKGKIKDVNSRICYFFLIVGARVE